MTEDIASLERYSVVIVPALAVLEQLGIPVPAVPALLATGALAASGRVNLWLVIVAIVLVTLPIDLVWHEAGRRLRIQQYHRAGDRPRCESRAAGGACDRCRPRHLRRAEVSAAVDLSSAAAHRQDHRGRTES